MATNPLVGSFLRKVPQKGQMRRKTDGTPGNPLINDFLRPLVPTIEEFREFPNFSKKSKNLLRSKLVLP